MEMSESAWMRLFKASSLVALMVSVVTIGNSGIASSLTRNSYKPYTVKPTIGSPREEFDLDGNWLFMPDLKTSYTDPSCSDDSWHVMDVPDFWQPKAWWISSSISPKYVKEEEARVARYTFDSAKTREGCYRHWIIVPKSMKGKRISISFDGAATLADVYWNGHKVGRHAGMFGRFDCEVTPYVRWGEKNLLAVCLSVGSNEKKDDDKVVGVAVTVRITKSMLSWFPHGAFGSMGYVPVAYGGLWQSVRLVATGGVRAEKIRFTPTLDSATIVTDVSGDARKAILEETLVSKGENRILWKSRRSISVKGNSSVTTRSPRLHPRLWSPEHPNLYILKTRIIVAGTPVDEKKTQVGFRTFVVKGDTFYLNGKPYRLRGADMPPYGMRPNDGRLAHKFFNLMHSGNQMVTRSHCSPYNEIWATAADEEGVAVSSEGIWPWALMKEIPNDGLLKHWKKEQLEVIGDLYNHPSIIINTIGNEMMQGCCQDVHKWKIMSDLVKAVRKTDPTRPIVFSSEMARAFYDKQWRDVLSPGGYDDGDIDDVHCYYGWYQPSAMMLDFTKPIPVERFSPTKGRAFISQECGTGYPSVDGGYSCGAYPGQFMIPQAWAGKYVVPGHGSSDLFLRSIADINKETAEKLRRQCKYWAGNMLFANLCWYKNCYDADKIQPYPVHYAVKMAYSSVLVSLDSPQRHLFAGDSFDSRVCIANDDIDLPNAGSLTLSCWVEDRFGRKLTPVSKERVGDCRYYAQVWADVSIRMPDIEGRNDAALCFKLTSSAKAISANRYDIVICGRRWACERPDVSGKVVMLNGDPGERAFDNARNEAEQGRTVLWLNAGESARTLMPSVIESAQKYAGEFVDTNDPNLRLFDGLKPFDMRWWYSPGKTPSVTEVQFRLKKGSAARSFTTFVRPHFYMSSDEVRELPHTTLFEITCGKGRIIVSSMRTEAAETDPMAARFLSNLYRYSVKQD
jgi:hypothetical protein